MPRSRAWLAGVVGLAVAVGLTATLSDATPPRGALAPAPSDVSSGAPAARAATTGGVPRPDHVVVVIEENHGLDQIIGAPDAPYINSLAAGGASMTRSYAVTHPSQPNYLALFSGDTQGVSDDYCPQSFTGVENLGSELLGAGLSFGGYSEGLPSAGSTVCSAGGYARKHNPWVDFANVPAASNLTLSDFPTDFTKLPTVSIVVPNLDDDMHDGTVADGDAWLKAHLDGYVRWAKAHNSLLVLTWDEDDSGGDNRIATIFSGPGVRPGAYGETINHYDVLRTLEDAYGLAHAGRSATATPITDIWGKGGGTGPPARLTIRPVGSPTARAVSRHGLSAILSPIAACPCRVIVSARNGAGVALLRTAITKRRLATPGRLRVRLGVTRAGRRLAATAFARRLTLRAYVRTPSGSRTGRRALRLGAAGTGP